MTKETLMGDALFELTDFAPPAPDWAEECFYCVPDKWGRYDKKHHLAAHQPVTCAICGQTSPNRVLAEDSHRVNLGASRELGKLVCTALSLWLNHLTYARRHNLPFPKIGSPQHPQDWRALTLGWTIGPDGEQIPPDGWPDKCDDHNYGVLERAA